MEEGVTFETMAIEEYKNCNYKKSISLFNSYLYCFQSCDLPKYYVYYNIGCCYIKIFEKNKDVKELESAIKSFYTAIELSSENNEDYWFNLGYCFEQLNNINKSIVCFKVANNIKHDELINGHIKHLEELKTLDKVETNVRYFDVNIVDNKKYNLFMILYDNRITLDITISNKEIIVKKLNNNI